MPAQPCDTPVGLLPALGLKSIGLKAALVMKSRDYLVVVDRAEQVRALSPDFATLAKLDAGNGTIVTAPGEGGVDYVCRMFLPSAGIDEDPATGSIHCTLAPYWAGRLGKEYVSCATTQCSRWNRAVHNRRRSRKDRWPGTLVPSRHARTLKRLPPARNGLSAKLL